MLGSYRDPVGNQLLGSVPGKAVRLGVNCAGPGGTAPTG